MLVIFKCKAAGDIIMYEENARPILDLFERETRKGILMADEMGALLAKLEAEVASRKAIEAEEQARIEAEEAAREARAREKGDLNELERLQRDKERRKERPFVSFAARAYPLMEMMKRAQQKKKDIVWGV